MFSCKKNNNFNPVTEHTSSKAAIDNPAKTIKFARPSNNQWWQELVTYQLWPRSFYDSDNDGNGDFNGISKKLPYLKELGIKAIWLTPIFEAPSYHGYDATNYFQVESDYGTMIEFENLLKDAKKQDIKIILDLVINHASSQHPWFIKSSQKEAGYEDYFVWSKDLPKNYAKPWTETPAPEQVWHYSEIRKEWYYAVFDYTQPDLNLKNPKVAEEIKKIAAFWLDKGVDGFRLDAVRYFIEEGGIPNQADTKSNYAFLKEFKEFIEQKNPNAMLIGEAFADSSIVSSYYQEGKGIDAAFDFEFSLNIASALEAKPMALAKTPEEKNAYILLVKNALWNNLEKRRSGDTPNAFFVPFINNHDLDRLSIKTDNNSTKLQIAASLLLTSPGSVYIYYGEEIGMGQAGLYDDMYRRAPMQWDSSDTAGFNMTGKRWIDDPKSFPWHKNFDPWWEPYWKGIKNKDLVSVTGQDKKPDSLLNLYRTLIGLRNKYDVIRNPETIHYYATTANAWVVSYLKGNKRAWIILNLDADAPALIDLPPVMQTNLYDAMQNHAVNFNQEVQLAVNAGELLIYLSE